MSRCVHVVFFLLLAFTTQQVLSNSVSLKDINSQIGIGKKIVKIALEIWGEAKTTMKRTSDVAESNDPAYKPPNDSVHKELIDTLRHLSQQNKDLSTNIITVKDETISEIIRQVPVLIELSRRLSKIFVNSVHVQNSFNSFVKYYLHPEKYDKDLLSYFAQSNLYDESGVGNLLHEINTLLIEDDFTSPSTIGLLIDNMELYLQYANVLKSPQQLLYDILQSVLNTEIKGYLTMKFSNRLLKILNKDSGIRNIEGSFGRRVNKTVDIFKSFLSLVPRDVWSYNPPNTNDASTYTELKHLFQEFVINEFDVSPDDSCKNTCKAYQNPQGINKNRCYYNNEICSVTHCEGYLYDCRKQVNTKMTICPSPMGSSRRYEYIDYANGLRYGEKNATCSVNPILTHASHLSLWYSCDSCMCVCADLSKKSERFFSLEPSMTNFTDNYVLTGARFIKKNRIIHIQVQEGQLLKNGFINESTVRWVPVKENPLHVHNLIWDESRSINLDNILTPNNYVLTGLSFVAEVNSKYQRRLHLKAFSTLLSFEDGQLLHKHKFEQTDKAASEEISMEKLDIPTRKNSLTRSEELSRPGSYLQFGPSDLEKDAGQSTIPFIDLQEVKTNPPVPMSGVGLFHRGRNNTGGFIALKLFTFDFTNHLE